LSYEALQNAGSSVTKENFPKCVVELAIPYGFNKISLPEDLVPYLNGAIVRFGPKQTATPPEVWRRLPDPHELLADMCTRLGLPPWGYATRSAEMESFRVLAFNEKEPLQDYGESDRKPRGGRKKDDGGDDSGGTTGGGGGGGDLLSF
jgi:AMMECR1 domain-containing protein